MAMLLPCSCPSTTTIWTGMHGSGIRFFWRRLPERGNKSHRAARSATRTSSARWELIRYLALRNWRSLFHLILETIQTGRPGQVALQPGAEVEAAMLAVGVVADGHRGRGKHAR